jgi:hypothetical protein
MYLLFKSTGVAGSVWVKNTSEGQASYVLDGVTFTLQAGETREHVYGAGFIELHGDSIIMVASDEIGLG